MCILNWGSILSAMIQLIELKTKSVSNYSFLSNTIFEISNSNKLFHEKSQDINLVFQRLESFKIFIL